MSMARHTGYNVAGGVVPIAFSLLLTPLFISTVGLARYGLLAICWALLGYFGLFDFGTGRAVAQRIAARQHGSAAQRSQAFWTALALCLPLCAAAALIIIAVQPLITGFLQVSDRQLAAELPQAITVLALAVPLAMITTFLTGALEGVQRFGFVNAVSIVTNALVLSAPLLTALLISKRLDVLVAMATLARLPGIAALALASARLVPLQSPSLERTDIRALFSFGSWTTMSSIVGGMILLLDRALVGRLAGAAAIGLYTLPFTLLSQVQILPNAASRAMYPKVAAAIGTEGVDDLRELVAFLNFAVTVALCAVALGCAPFLVAWLGWSTGASAAPVAYALIIGIWANSLAIVIAVQLQAQAKMRFVALLHLAEILPSVVLFYFATKWFGVVGAAFACSVRAVADASIFFWRVPVRIDFGPMLRSAFGLLLISGTSLLMPLNSPGRWVAVATLSAGTALNAWLQRPSSVRRFETAFWSTLPFGGPAK